MKFSLLKYFNYIYFSKAINIDYIEGKSLTVSVLKVIPKAFLFTFYAFRSFALNTACYTSRRKIVFFCMSENNYLSVNSIYNGLPKGSAQMFADRLFYKNVTLFIPTVLSTLIA